MLFQRATEKAEKVEPLKSSREVMEIMYRLLIFMKNEEINGDVLEIGVKKGKTTVFLAEILKELYPESKLITFDPFTDEGAKQSLKKEANQIKKIQKTFEFHTQKLKNHLHFNRSSEDFPLLLPDCGLMLTFIDGEHTFDAVMRDFDNVFNETVNGGVIAIDDYQNSAWPGVPRAYRKIRQIYKNYIELNYCTPKTVFLRKIKHVSRSGIQKTD